MEQGLSFIALITLLMILLFVVQSPIGFLIVFFGGCTYLLIRGRKMYWEWPHRP